MHVPWPEIRTSLAAAIRAALPLQVAQAGEGLIAAIGLYIDAFEGHAGLYLLPETFRMELEPGAAANIGDWPISTDWDLSSIDSKAFSASWSPWVEWFAEHLDGFSVDEHEAKHVELLRAACGAMADVEAAGAIDSFMRTRDFRVIICEHDDSDDGAATRYDRFKRTGKVLVQHSPGEYSLA